MNKLGFIEKHDSGAITLHLVTGNVQLRLHSEVLSEGPSVVTWFATNVVPPDRPVAMMPGGKGWGRTPMAALAHYFETNRQSAETLREVAMLLERDCPDMLVKQPESMA